MDPRHDGVPKACGHGCDAKVRFQEALARELGSHAKICPVRRMPPRFLARLATEERFDLPQVLEEVIQELREAAK